MKLSKEQQKYVIERVKYGYMKGFNEGLVSGLVIGIVIGSAIFNLIVKDL
jgi:hypothetical protein